MNESETRAEHIAPTLKAAGWGVVQVFLETEAVDSILDEKGGHVFLVDGSETIEQRFIEDVFDVFFGGQVWVEAVDSGSATGAEGSPMFHGVGSPAEAG